MSRPRSARNARRSTSRMTPTLLAWSAVGLVVVIVVALVVVKLAVGAGPSSGSAQAVLPASPQLVREVSSVPASVFDEVGVAIPSAFVGNPPITVSGQPPLTLDGRTPTVLYYGAEYCPYCAAERWALVVALARFGTWHGLDTTASGLLDGDYRTFSFRHAVLDSPYVHFVPIEACTNRPDPGTHTCSPYGVLQTPTPDEARVLDRYGGPSFVPNDTEGIDFPFVDIDNRMLISGSTYQPTVLADLTQSEIAGVLTDPTDPLTQSIVGTANEISAGICAATGGMPTSVCSSPGVQSATRMLQLA